MKESTDFYTEAFEVSETDFEFAMFPGKRRYHQTKEQAMLGMWADDEDDGDRPHFSGGKKKPDFSAPISFISGGVKIGNKINSDQQEDENIILADNQDIISHKEKRFKHSEKLTKQHKVGGNVFAGMRASNTHSSSSPQVDSTGMKFGKSVMQMMQKMGYIEGKGLGKEKQGIVEPVKAFTRPGRGAIGAYGREAQGPKFGESAADAQARISGVVTDEQEGDQVIGKRENWKRSNAYKREKVRYKTLDEVVSDSVSTNHQFVSFSGQRGVGKIIDMTGPEQRVYDDFSAFSRKSKMHINIDRSKFDVPELVHNLNTLMDVNEDEICKAHNEIKYLEDQTDALKQEDHRLQEHLSEEKSEIDRLRQIEQIIKTFHRKIRESKPPTLDECKDLFIHLRQDFPVEYQLYEIGSLSIPIVLPLIKAFYAKWEPLDPSQSNHGWDILNEWRDILTNTKSRAENIRFDSVTRENSNLSNYDNLVWYGWMPTVRDKALKWSPRENSPIMVNLMNVWLPIIPIWIADNLLEQIIVGRIKRDVDEWDPLLDRIPIHTWVIPWQELLGHRLLPVHSVIRQKLSKGLKRWEPKDRSAFESIMPWKNIFSAGTMASFLGTNIVPKLEAALQRMDIESIEDFKFLELFKWMALIDKGIIAQILLTSFFPKYYAKVCTHLTLASSVPRHIRDSQIKEIKQEYITWKNLIPKEFADIESIKGQLSQILIEIMKAEGNRSFAYLPQKPNLTNLVQPPPPPPSTTDSAPSNFRQLVEQRATQLGILFCPQNKKYEGKQIYSFGDESIYFEETLIHLYNIEKRKWKPIGLESLISNCLSSLKC